MKNKLVIYYRIPNVEPSWEEDDLESDEDLVKLIRNDEVLKCSFTNLANLYEDKSFKNKLIETYWKIAEGSEVVFPKDYKVKLILLNEIYQKIVARIKELVPQTEFVVNVAEELTDLIKRLEKKYE